MVARLQPLGGVPKNGALNEMQRSAPHRVGEGGLIPERRS
jgi:hypothetical protein